MRISKKQGRLRVSHNREDINPMDGMANLVDVMLVFACGLIVALIAAWNVDVKTEADLPKEVHVQNQATEEQVKNTDNLEEVSKVFKDPSTGKLYIINE